MRGCGRGRSGLRGNEYGEVHEGSTHISPVGPSITGAADRRRVARTVPGVGSAKIPCCIAAVHRTTVPDAALATYRKVQEDRATQVRARSHGRNDPDDALRTHTESRAPQVRVEVTTDVHLV